ncbi:unnamed protein product [Rotaria socialis]|uniref:Uncharacterized protein n=1 Tax=Rotaria socialis TaxID=392032 RepID=A0A820FY59_9BILA|nr:unnamed protein product [Rotaria socialis]CAF3362261.1 unnamed protein product [Rotaria socialis]CAF4271814.1 unnamed protein product [Rotaria socialis]CAF4489033.1 unnamed protein product [Rotaria socialis]
MAAKRLLADIDDNHDNKNSSDFKSGLKVQNGENKPPSYLAMNDEPAKKRRKSMDSNVNDQTDSIKISTTIKEEEYENIPENQLDKELEQEEQKADNIVIRDIMGSVKPESNKKMSDEERRTLYDNVYSKLLVLLERCQKYVHHLNNKIKQSMADHGHKKKTKKHDGEEQTKSTEDDIKRTGLLKKYYDMTDKDIVARQPKLFVGSLKPYQLAGLEWLRTLHEVGLNGILADEMGLGKTVQVIAFICSLVQDGAPGPFLVVAPLSTLTNWCTEFARFAPEVTCMVYHGNKEKLAELRNKIYQHRQTKKASPIVLITAYHIIVSDKAFFKREQWPLLVVDEGHRLKNPKCQLMAMLRRIHTGSRFLLTGTPVQNNMSEMWSLMNFLLPEIFDEPEVFERYFEIDSMSNSKMNFKEEQERSVLSIFHQILIPFILRRRKGDVNLYLPPKKEVTVYTKMTSLQVKWYNKLVDEIIRRYIDDRKKDDFVQVFDDTKRLRSQRKNEIPTLELKEDVIAKKITGRSVVFPLLRACTHPYLLDAPRDENGEIIVNEDLITSSGKFILLDKMLGKLRLNNHKVLIFSTLVIFLDLLEAMCEHRNYGYARLDGNTSFDERIDAISTFNKDPDVFIFLISTRAGGLGLNLMAADTVVLFNSDWNPMIDMQAQDRAHRIGQTKPVIVYRFIVRNTIDERVYKRACSKQIMEKLIVHDELKQGFDAYETVLSFDPQGEQAKSINLAELVEGITKIEQRTIITENDVISEEHIDRLLDRSDLIEAMNCEEDKRINQLSHKCLY